MCFYTEKYRAAKKGKIKRKLFMTAFAIARDIVKDTNRSKLSSRSTGIMHLSANKIKITKKCR